MKQNVILVDKHNEHLGLMGKYEAHHKPGFLHRAISVLLYRKVDEHLELLLQQRSAQKPLWPMIWANTCCTHPIENESYIECAVRRLKEELGISINAQDLSVLYSFYYQVDYDEAWSEHELDTVIVGEYSGEVTPNLDEVVDYRWVKWEELKNDLQSNIDQYAPWFRMMISDQRFLAKLRELA